MQFHKFINHHKNLIVKFLIILHFDLSLWLVSLGCNFSCFVHITLQISNKLAHTDTAACSTAQSVYVQCMQHLYFQDEYKENKDQSDRKKTWIKRTTFRSLNHDIIIHYTYSISLSCLTPPSFLVPVSRKDDTSLHCISVRGRINPNKQHT